MKKEKRSTVTNLNRDDFIKKKLRESELELLGVGLVSILFVCIFTNSLLRTIIVLVLGMVECFILKKLIIYLDFTAKFDKLSRYLSSKSYTEVIPIPTTAHKHSYFFIRLADIAKFYAIISDDLTVAVYLKFNTEKKYRFIEKIRIKDFFSYYKIK